MAVHVPVLGALLFLRKSMAGARELEHFPTEEQREEAINRILLRPLTWYEGVFFFIAIAMLFPQTGWHFVGWPIWQGVNVVLSVATPRWIAFIVYYALVLSLLFLTLRLYHRLTTRKRIRHMLLGLGIPICAKCGYDLRGQSVNEQRCSECGHPYGYWVMRTITHVQQSNAPRRDSSG